MLNSSGEAFLYGDANLDGVVDDSDFNVWNNNMFAPIAAWSSGDFNADGVVDVSDFNVWNTNKFQVVSQALAVPEPEACLHFAVGMKYIRATRSTTGFRCRAKLDKSRYPKKTIITDDQKAAVQLTRSRVLPKWNYTIKPRKR